MQRGLAVLLCVLSIFLAGCATHRPSKSRAEKRVDKIAARTAAVKWLKLLDDGDYEEAFEWEAPNFRVSRTQKQFVRYMRGHREPFGRVLSRTSIGAAAIQKLVGAPDGNYESIIFKTAFEHKSPTAERVILVKQSIGWRVIDYRIY
jgi:Protein of unknown function (DUF4019)